MKYENIFGRQHIGLENSICCHILASHCFLPRMKHAYLLYLEEKMATHSGILPWEIPWTEEPSGLQCMGSQRVGRDLVTKQQQPVVSEHWYNRLVLLGPMAVRKAKHACPEIRMLCKKRRQIG